MKRIAYLLSIFVVLGSALLSTIALAEAQTNQAVSKTSRKVIAPLYKQIGPPDPGGWGGGGITCVTNCTMCDVWCHPNGNCAPICFYSGGDGGCGCEYSGNQAEICGDIGSCTYY